MSAVAVAVAVVLFIGLFGFFSLLLLCWVEYERLREYQRANQLAREAEAFLRREGSVSR